MTIYFLYFLANPTARLGRIGPSSLVLRHTCTNWQGKAVIPVTIPTH